MCLPETLEAFRNPTISRRNLFKIGLGAAAATAALGVTGAEAAPIRPTRFSNVMDLTHVLGPNMPGFPGVPAGFEINIAVAHKENGFYGNILRYWEHVGTHMDAPAHFVPDALYVDQIAPTSLIVPAVVIDITERAKREPATVVTPDDIRAWERRHGRIPDNAAVLMATGWGARAGSVEAYRNTDASGVMQFPGFGTEAIQFLVAERNPAGIGVDTLSLDHGPSTTFSTHLAWLSTNRWGLENLANLEAIPPSGATLFVGAPKVASGSGGPSRVLAVW
ncbi:MAG TPA: cyclase family protein [Roseiflexaceae bacterium]|nr:cyclase family protein [Roseiflexaceae bacterium]